MLHERSDTPIVSVVITTYRHERFIARCLQSVLDQDLAGMEVIVLDDASPDGTGVAIQPFTADGRVTYIRNETNLGSKKNNGRALQMGTGKYVVWLHGDDYLLPGHLHDALEVLEANPRCALAYSPCYWADQDGRILMIKNHPGHLTCRYAGGRNEFAELLVHDNYITPSSAVMRREALQAVGTIDQDVAMTSGDWDLFVRIAASWGDFAFIDRASTVYRIHAGQVSHDFYANDAPLKAHVGVLEKSLASPHAGRLAGWERAVMEHLQGRLAAYPGEVRARYERRAGVLMQRLEESARAHRCRPVGEYPMVSVVVPTINRPELLQDALASLVGQSYENWEAVVVNDAGDDVSALVQGLDSQGRIRCVRHHRNRGLAAARNTGLRLSGGDIVCYLDDDDRYYPDHLARVVAAFQEDPQRGVVYSEAQYVSEEVHQGARAEKGRDRRYGGTEFSLERLHVGNYIPVNAWAHRRWLVGEVGMFDEDMPALEDWDLLLRMARAAPVHHLHEVTVEVRERGDGSRLSQHKRHLYPSLIRRVYERYDDGGSTAVADARRRALAQIDAAADRTAAAPPDNDPYTRWCRASALTEAAAQLMAERMVLQWHHHPSIHLLMVVNKGDAAALGVTLASLTAQLYQGWGLTVLADFGAPAGLFEGAANVEWITLQGRDPEAAANEAVAATGAEWVAVLEPGDRLPPHGLFGFADYINRNPEWRAVYSDTDTVAPDGTRSDGRFHPDFNVDLLRSQPYFGNFCLIHRVTLEAGGGLQYLRAAAGYDAVLRVMEAGGEAAVGHAADVLFHRARANAERAALPAARQAARQAVAGHLRRCGVDAGVADGRLPGSHFIDYRHAAAPLVSIIVPTKDRLDLLRPCLETLLAKTDYGHYEVLVVDNDSADPHVLQYLDELPRRDPRVRVLRYPHPYNFSAINNYAAREARGDYLLLLNNDTEVLHGDWLTRMMAHGQRPEVGIVGARLLFADGRIQHAGVVMGMQGVANHIHGGLSGDEPGYLGRAQLVQNFSAVTAACMLIRRAVYVQAGGLDERRFKVLFNDVDLCLKAGELGYKVVWTPYATLLHHGSSSLTAGDTPRGPAGEPQEAFSLMHKWLPHVAHDAAYNRNLSLLECDPRVEGTVVPAWNPDFHDRPRVLVYPGGAGAPAAALLVPPMQALAGCARAEVTFMPLGGARHLSIAEMARLAPDVLLVSDFMDELQIGLMELYRRFLPELRLVFFAHATDSGVDGGRLRRAFALCDRLIVARRELRAAYARWAPEIVVAPAEADGIAEWLAAVTGAARAQAAEVPRWEGAGI